jgi:hypothetical protein
MSEAIELGVGHRSPCFPTNPDFDLSINVPLAWPEVDADLERPFFAMHPRDKSCISKIAGHRLDVIDGVGVAQDGLGGSTLVQTDNVGNPYRSDIALGVAIVRSIFLCLGWDFLKDRERSPEPARMEKIMAAMQPGIPSP